MNDTNPHAGRGGGGRRHRRRGGRKGRGGRGERGGRGGGQEGRRGNKSTFSKKEEGADTAVLMKQADVVVVEKVHNENKSPQDPNPPTPNESFAKNVDELKKVLGVGVDNATLTSSNSNSGDTKNAAGAQGAPPCGTVADNVQSEKEKMQQKLKEAREQAAAAKEKKKSKKSKKHEKWLKEQQQQQEYRAKSWTDKVKKEEEKCHLISDLIGTEFQRVNEGVEMNEEIQKVIVDKSKEAHDAMYGSDVRCRVTVVGLDRKDLNGRKGSIRHWDEDKGKFCVGLDTKKSRDCDVHFIKPEYLDALPSAQSSANKKDGKLAAFFTVSITGLTTPTQGDNGIGCQFNLEKSDVSKLESAHSRSNGLQEFRDGRDARAHAFAQRLMKEQEEQRKEEERLEKEEEEDRKRRAELRAKKRAEKERKKEEQRQKREEAFKLKQMQAQLELERKQAEEMIELTSMLRKISLIKQLGKMYHLYFHEWFEEGGRVEDFDDFKEDFKEVMAKLIPDGFELGEQERDEIFEEIFEATDEEFKEMLIKDRLEDDMKHAAILGVSHDVDKRTLQKTYRTLARQYHPDKWSIDSAHGMSKEEAEEHFKTIRNSYDHLMGKFDE